MGASMLYLGGEFVFFIVSGWALLSIIEALYEKKFSNRKICYGTAFALYVICGFAVSMCRWPCINLIYTMVFLYTISRTLYKSSPKKAITNSIVVIAYFALLDLIVTSIYSVGVGTTTNLTLANDRMFLVSGICNALAMLCTCNMVIQLITHINVSKASKYMNLYTVLLMVFELFFLCYFIESNNCYLDNIGLLILAVGFVLIDGSIIYFFKMFTKISILENRTSLAEKQCEMTGNYYENLKKQNEEMLGIMHDFKKHLRVIDDLKQSEAGKGYINELLNSISMAEQQFQCDNEILRTIICEKIQICKRENMILDLNLQYAEFDFMEKNEITSLFSNLLDNAIEACLESDKEKKEIYLRVHRFKNHIVIAMRNTIGLPLQFRDGQLLSNKTGHLGLGMLVIKSITEKYCGSMEYSYSEEYFQTKLVLAIQK